MTFSRQFLFTSLSLAGCVLAIGSLAITSGCGSPTSRAAELEAANQAAIVKASSMKLQVVLDRVVKESISAQSEFTGSLLPARGTQVMAEVEGIAESFADIGPLVEADVDGKHYSLRLAMQPGTKVKEGQVLVQLERTNFELDVAIAKARVDKAKADLAKLIAWERARIDCPHQGSVGRSESAKKIGRRRLSSRHDAVTTVCGIAW